MRGFTLRVAGCVAAAMLLQTTAAHAGFQLGAASQFAVLYTGSAADALSDAGTIDGNVGIGGSGYMSAPGAFVGGKLEYAASSLPKNNNTTGATITGGTSLNNTNVTAALATLSSLSTTLGAETGTTTVGISASSGHNQTITVDQSVASGGGTLDANGNYVYKISSVSLANGGVLTINGAGLTAGQDVVFNITATSPNFDGAIVLTGGLSANQVLFNVVGSGSSHKLTIAAGSQTLNADFLDYSGAITMTSGTLDGSLYGGDSATMTISSGAVIKVPEPSSLALLAVGIAGLASRTRRRKTNRAG